MSEETKMTERKILDKHDREKRNIILKTVGAITLSLLPPMVVAVGHRVPVRSDYSEDVEYGEAVRDYNRNSVYAGLITLASVGGAIICGVRGYNKKRRLYEKYDDLHDIVLGGDF